MELSCQLGLVSYDIHTSLFGRVSALSMYSVSNSCCDHVNSHTVMYMKTDTCITKMCQFVIYVGVCHDSTNMCIIFKVVPVYMVTMYIHVINSCFNACALLCQLICV